MTVQPLEALSAAKPEMQQTELLVQHLLFEQMIGQMLASSTAAFETQATALFSTTQDDDES